MAKINKRTLLAAATVPAMIALVVMLCIPTIAASTQADYRHAMDPQNWVAEGEGMGTEMGLSGEMTVMIDAWGYAFQRVDNETIKQLNCTTHLMVVVTPATEESERAVEVTGSVTIGDSAYAITDGKAFLGREKKLLYVNCTGADDAGNEISLKFGGHYFWWGGKAFALRTKAMMQTEDGPMLLLQRGIVKIN